MDITVSIVRSLFEPISGDVSYALRDKTTQVLSRQDKSMLVSAIVDWEDAAFNRQQVVRLVQELRAIAVQESLDDRTRTNLVEAADFIERETDPRLRSFVVFLGN